MFSITRPAIIFADADNVEILKSAIKEINLNVPVYVFGEKIDAAASVNEFFQDTGLEKKFM